MDKFISILRLKQTIDISVKIRQYQHSEGPFLCLRSIILTGIVDIMKQLSHTLSQQLFIFMNISYILTQTFDKHLINIEVRKYLRILSLFLIHLRKLTISRHQRNICQLKVKSMVLFGRFHVAEIVDIFIILLEVRRYYLCLLWCQCVFVE